MAYTRILNYAFNRGIISPLALARFDLKRLALSAQVCFNWMFRTLGSMMLRPGLVYVDSTYNNEAAVHLPFIFSVIDTAIIELTNNLMRVRVNEVIIMRPSVTTTITGGNPFVTGLTGWTNGSDVGGTAAFSSPYLALSGNGVARGLVYQDVTVSGGNIGVQHGIRIVVEKGYVTLRIGTSVGDDSIVKETTLNPGTHSLAITPSGNFYIQMASATQYTTLVTSCYIEAAGAMTLPTPWPSSMLGYLRKDESADVVFVASDGSLPQMRIERRAIDSWSIVNYYADDGPFQNQNIDQSITLAASGLSGDITLTSNIPFFNSGMVGCLFSLQSTAGSAVSDNASGANQFTNPIEVTGVGAQRNLNYAITGTWVGTVSLEYSVGSPGAWVSAATYTGNSTSIYNDGFDNQTIFYRLGFETGNYTSGTAAVSLSFSLPSGNAGVVRIDSITNSTTAAAHVLPQINQVTGADVLIDSTQPTSLWSQGIWNSNDGFPSALCFYQGRLWQFGQDYILGSVSDAYSSYNQTISGNSGPIIRTIAQGPVSIIQWALGLTRLLIGCDGNEQSAFSNALAEPLSPTDFNIQSPSTRGSAAVAALKIDINGIFVQRGDPTTGNTSGTRLIQMAYQGVYAVIDYTSTDLSEFCPEILAVGISKIAVQRKIDTRIHCLLTNGTVAVCVYDPIENEKGFTLVETGGNVIDVFVMPGGVEDLVYYVVQRTINSQVVTYLERWALESQCAGGTVNMVADSLSVITNGSPSTAVSVPHLAAAKVCIWADGADIDQSDTGGVLTQLDSSGNCTLATAATNVVVGLPYTAQFQTVKLTQTVHDGTSLGFARSIDHIGLILANAHYQGLRYGYDFSHLDPLPQVTGGLPQSANTIYSSYDDDPIELDGTWTPDARLCLQAMAPRPVTVLAANIGVETGDS